MELRTYPRVPIAMEIDLHGEQRLYPGVTADISQGGLFIATFTPPPLGTVVDLMLNLPNANEGFPARGQVCWVRGGRRSAEGPAGCGLRWLLVSAQMLAKIAEFVERSSQDVRPKARPERRTAAMAFERTAKGIAPYRPPKPQDPSPERLEEAELLEVAASQVPQAAPPPIPIQSEQRAFPRVAVEVEVDLESEHNFYAGITGDVSEGGIFIATAVPPPVGSMVELLLKLPTAPAGFTITGEVCWVRELPQSSFGFPAGCGIRWLELPAETMASVTQFVERRETMLFEQC